MIKYRPANTRGHVSDTWISSFRTFSNNTYYDPEYIHYSDLEVINDDTVQSNNFVPIHQHCDMEILGYVIDGPCYHNDNLQNVGEVPSGCVQRMSAGRGIWHTEGNMSNHPIRYLQIWMRPNKHNFAPLYDVMEFTKEDKLNNFCPIASENGPIIIQSDVKVFAGIFNDNFQYSLSLSRRYYLYIITGSILVNDILAETGDGFSFENESVIYLVPNVETEVLLFSLR